MKSAIRNTRSAIPAIARETIPKRIKYKNLNGISWSNARRGFVLSFSAFPTNLIFTDLLPNV